VNSVLQVLDESTAPSGTWTSDAAATLWIGDRKDDDRCFDGKISEVRISNIVRTAAWLKATYHTLFDTIGAWDTAIEGPALGTWAYRRKFTISAAKISAELTDFPIAFSIDASCGLGADDLSAMFTRIVAADKKKIAVTDRDKITQLYAEIENWDSDNSKALLHIKVPKIPLGKDYEIYLHYDAAQDENTQKVGVAGEAVVNYVWDSNFVGVWHMAQDPSGGAGAILDSTSNGNDLTSIGTMTTADLIDGLKGGKAIDFDGTDDALAKTSSPVSAWPVTLEATARRDASVNHNTLINIEDADDADEQFGIALWGDDKALLHAYTNAAGFNYVQSAGTIAQDAWCYIAGVYIDATEKNLYLNGAYEDVMAVSTAFPTVADHITIGLQGDSSPANYIDGKMSEARISDSARSAAWIEATYNALFDLLGTWAAEEAVGAANPDVNVSVGAAAIIFAAPAALVGVGVLAGPAAIIFAAPAATIGVGADAGPAEITFAVPSSSIIQNLHAIGIMSKPTVTAKGPSATVTAKQPGATVTGKGPSANVTAKGE